MDDFHKQGDAGFVVFAVLFFILFTVGFAVNVSLDNENKRLRRDAVKRGAAEWKVKELKDGKF